MIKTSNQLSDCSFIFELSLTVCFTIAMLSNYYISNEQPKMFFLDIVYLRYLIYIILWFALLLYIICSYDNIFINIKNFFIILIGTIFIFLLFYFRGSFSFSDLMRVIIFFPFIFGPKEIDAKRYMKRSYFSLIIFISLLSSFLQGTFFYDIHKSRLTTRMIFNSNDPNYSALYFFLCFLLSYKLRYSGLKYIFLFLGLLTQSRNFILGIMVFYIIGYFESIPFFQKIFSKVKPIFVLVFFQIAVLLFGAWFINVAKSESDRDTFSLQDDSNIARFTFSAQSLLFLSSGTRMAVIDGAGEEYWQRGNGKGTAKIIWGPAHNSFLGLFVEKGIIFSIINCILLFVIMNQYTRVSNYKYIYSYLFMSLFLGGFTMGYNLLCFYYILSIKNYHKTN